jgi:hypothetical protein
MARKGWISNRFKDEESREWHTRTAHEASESADKARLQSLQKAFPGLTITNINTGTIRIEKGGKKLDLFQRRYFKVSEGERGDHSIFDDEKIIKEYFNLNEDGNKLRHQPTHQIRGCSGK